MPSFLVEDIEFGEGDSCVAVDGVGVPKVVFR